MGTNRATDTIKPKVPSSYRTTQKVKVPRSITAPINDSWSVEG